MADAQFCADHIDLSNACRAFYKSRLESHKALRERLASYNTPSPTPAPSESCVAHCDSGGTNVNSNNDEGKGEGHGGKSQVSLSTTAECLSQPLAPGNSVDKRHPDQGRGHNCQGHGHNCQGHGGNCRGHGRNCQGHGLDSQGQTFTDQGDSVSPKSAYVSEHSCCGNCCAGKARQGSGPVGLQDNSVNTSRKSNTTCSCQRTKDDIELQQQRDGQDMKDNDHNKFVQYSDEKGEKSKDKNDNLCERKDNLCDKTVNLCGKKERENSCGKGYNSCEKNGNCCSSGQKQRRPCPIDAAMQTLRQEMVSMQRMEL